MRPPTGWIRAESSPPFGFSAGFPFPPLLAFALRNQPKYVRQWSIGPKSPNYHRNPLSTYQAKNPSIASLIRALVGEATGTRTGAGSSRAGMRHSRFVHLPFQDSLATWQGRTECFRTTTNQTLPAQQRACVCSREEESSTAHGPRGFGRWCAVVPGRSAHPLWRLARCRRGLLTPDDIRSSSHIAHHTPVRENAWNARVQDATVLAICAP